MVTSLSEDLKDDAEPIEDLDSPKTSILSLHLQLRLIFGLKLRLTFTLVVASKSSSRGDVVHPCL